MAELDGQAFFVTGAASGMGRACAELAAQQGAAVMLGDLNEAGLAEVAEGIRQSGGRAAYLAGDVRDASWSEQAASNTWESFGALNGVICAAGIGTRHSVVEMPREDWDCVLGVNLTGTFLCTQAVVRAMLDRRQTGSVVTFASEVAFKGYVTGAHYAASKAGIVALTKTLAVEVSREGIRFNTVSPGLVATPMLEGFVSEHARDEWARAAAMRRIGDAGDVASVVCFLLSDASRWVTGQTLHVNGGHYMP